MPRKLKLAGLLACAGVTLWWLTRDDYARARLHHAVAHLAIGLFDERPWVMRYHDRTGEAWDRVARQREARGV